MADTRQFLKINVEFTGGLELLFSNQRYHMLSLPKIDGDDQPVNLRYLITFLCKHTMKSPKKDLFLLDQSVRPGILVLINDADWELEGGERYPLCDQDNILFVSTLHGG